MYTQSTRKGLRSPSLALKAYDRLRDMILAGEIRPGEPVYEVHSAKLLGMSRTPVREALQSLARDGYLEELPDRGCVVPTRSADDIREFFEMRQILESAAARLAAQRATDEEIARLKSLCDAYRGEGDLGRWQEIGAQFHTLIVAAARNRRLAQELSSLRTQIDLSRRSVIHAGGSKREAAVDDHRAIYEAIAARDEEAAYAAAERHVIHSYETTIRAFQPALLVLRKGG